MALSARARRAVSERVSGVEWWVQAAFRAASHHCCRSAENVGAKREGFIYWIFGVKQEDRDGSTRLWGDYVLRESQ